MVVGGGSGGHITPTIAVATEIKHLLPDCQIRYVIGRGDRLGDVVQDNTIFESVHHIFSGKFRRYHGEGWKQFLDIPTMLKNIRDAFFVGIGLLQSCLLLLRYRPDVIFIKGGFVGVPIGLMAALLRIPYVTHDSDAVPGLANRLIGRWATFHAVAQPKELYTYPQSKTLQVGIPVADSYHPVTDTEQRAFKETFGLPAQASVLLITGGGLGAQRLNQAMVSVVASLLADNDQLAVLHIAGRGKDDELVEQYESVLREDMLQRVAVEPFVTDMYRYSGAADVIVTRAGASTLAEFAAQGKACIVIPNPQLTGGHQLKNTTVLEDQHAVEVFADSALQTGTATLTAKISQLLGDARRRQKLAQNLAKTAQSDAALKLAKLVISTGKGGK